MSSDRFLTLGGLALALSLLSCETTSTDTGLPEGEEGIPTAAIGFYDAMAKRDFEAAAPFASASTKEYLAVTAKFFALIEEMEDFDDDEAIGESRVASILVDGDEAQVAIVASVEAEHDHEDGHEHEHEHNAEEQMTILLVREPSGWGVVGVQPEGKEQPIVFADRLEEARARLAEAEKERAGNPDFGPVVRAWIEAVIAEDYDAAAGCLTPDCAQRESDSERSFTNSFRKGEIRIDRWVFGRSESGDGEGQQVVRTRLLTKDGEPDGEPIRFRCVRTADGWKISEID